MLFNAFALRASSCLTLLLIAIQPGFFANKPFLWAVGGSVLGQLLVIYWAPMQAVFQTEALSLEDLGRRVFASMRVRTLFGALMPLLFDFSFAQVHSFGLKMSDLKISLVHFFTVRICLG